MEIDTDDRMSSFVNGIKGRRMAYAKLTATPDLALPQGDGSDAF